MEIATIFAALRFRRAALLEQAKSGSAGVDGSDDFREQMEANPLSIQGH
ncbi:MAG: hypothetical protein ACLT76_01520 [Clostridium fessum]